MATTKIVYLILPKLHLLDLAGPDQVFYEAKDYGVDIDMLYCSFTKDLQTSTHFPLGTLIHFEDVQFNAGDYLFIPGADVQYLQSKELAAETALIDWVKRAYTEGVHICTVCTGAFFLALTGLLDGKPCTTHWKRTAEFQTQFPKIKVQENILFTEEDRIFTSAGATSGIDLALHIVERLKDDFLSFKVARELVIYTRRTGNEAQESVFMKYRNHIHSGIHLVQEWLLSNLSKNPSLNELSDIACMSPRNLTRIFKKETGITVNEYVTILRQEKMKELLKNPDMTRAKIAQACGLKSERHLTRLMEKAA